MRIALHPASSVGVRAGRLLLGERALETLGITGTPVHERDPRVVPIEDVAGYDVFVTDDDDLTIARAAVEEGVPVVTWVDGDGLNVADPEVPVLTGANLATGIGHALLARELGVSDDTEASLLAWTEPGSSLRSGEPVTFPDPVGARWGRIRRREGDHVDVVVPVPDEWAGVVVRITEPDRTRILGIADLAEHLEALALTAGAVAVAGGETPGGRVRPEDVADAYLLAGLRAGLDVASFTATP